MRSISFVLVLSLLMGMAALTAIAQRSPTQQPARLMLDVVIPPDLQRQLNLTADQRKRLTALVERNSGQLQKLAEDKMLTQQRRSEQMGAILKKMEQDINAILTPKQREIRRKYQQEMVNKQMQNMPKATPEMMREIVNMGPEMVKKLAVTPDQLKKIDPIAQRTYKEFEKAMQNITNPSRADLNRMMTLIDKSSTEVRKILNPRQQKIYDESNAQRKKQWSEAQRRMEQQPPR
ncbi:MAG: hypothetical protein ACK4P3_03605 [Fimbriimonadaceae bacterium]